MISGLKLANIGRSYWEESIFPAAFASQESKLGHESTACNLFEKTTSSQVVLRNTRACG